MKGPPPSTPHFTHHLDTSHMVKKIFQTLGMLTAILFLASLVLFWLRDGVDGSGSTSRTSVPKLETPVGPPADSVALVLAITDEAERGKAEEGSSGLVMDTGRFFREADESSIAFLTERMTKAEIRAALGPDMTALQRKLAGTVSKVGKAFEALKSHYRDHAWRTEGESCPNYDIKRKGFSFRNPRFPGNRNYWVPERFVRIGGASGISVTTSKFELPTETLEATEIFLSVPDEALAGQIEKASQIYYLYDMNYEWRQTAFGDYSTEARPIIRDAFIVKDGTVIWSTFGHVGEKFPPDGPMARDVADNRLPASTAAVGTTAESLRPETAPAAPAARTEAVAPTRPSFDCVRASSFAEKAVCGDPVLAKLDVVLAKNYQFMAAADIGEGAHHDLKTTQGRWLAARDRCGDVECVADLYRKRIDEVCEYPVLSGIHPGCVESGDIMSPSSGGG